MAATCDDTIAIITSPAMIKMMPSYITHARLAEVGGAGYAVYFEKPDEFNRIVLEFLAEVSA